MLVDAHFHADDLAGLFADFASAYRGLGVTGLASAHDEAGFARTKSLMAGAGPYRLSYGIHPQLPLMDTAQAVATRAAAGELDAIGECGFDFYGDNRYCSREPANAKLQREAFEFQLALAERHDLPVVLHLRRASDLLFSYARRLARLRGVILHGWTGPANEALDFLKRCPVARFSFGTAILNGNRKSRASAAALPLGALLTESDAPFQPPRAEPKPGAPLMRAYSDFSDIARILGELSALRDMEAARLAEEIGRNFNEKGLFPESAPARGL